jgi:hypothetical protein
VNELLAEANGGSKDVERQQKEAASRINGAMQTIEA